MKVGSTRGQSARLLELIDEHEVTALLQRLIAIPTVNPPGHVRAASELCGSVLAGAGFTVKYASIVAEKPNLIATFGSEDGPTLCFNAHLDVVPTGDLIMWSHDPFGAVIADGRVVGRGALDDKASVVAQIMAGLAIARSGLSLKGRLVINAVADEEIGGPNGAALIVEDGMIHPDWVIVGEPTLNRVCIGERGGGMMVITVRGRTAHGALPWEGINAIDGAAFVLTALRSSLWPLLEARTHPYFHHSSASVTSITGGVKDNVVPDYCEIAIDRRFVPGEDPDECLEEVRSIAESAVAAVSGCMVSVEYRGEVNRASMIDPSSQLVLAMVGANAELGLSQEVTGFDMATDGRFFARAGYPVIIYGPGDPRLAHVPDESIGIVELMDATRAYALTAVALLRRAASDNVPMSPNAA